MLSSRAKIRPNVVLARQLQQQQRSLSKGATLRLSLNATRSYAAAATPQQQQDEAASDSIKHLIKGPVTPLTIFATSPPPAPHPSTYTAPAAAADGASLDFRLSFAFPTVQRIKEERFKEEMGVFKILHERPFLREYKNVMQEKQERRKNERRAARKALKERKKLGLVADDRKKTLFELEQDRQRKMYLQTLQYPFQLPEATVKADELKKYFNFIATHSEKEIYDRLYPEFFGDSREHVESLVPHKHDAYVWDTFFDPENPNEYSNQEEAEGDIWESLNKSAEEQLSDLADEMEGEQEKEARLAAWELDPGRFQGRWTPRDWPKEDLELSHIKHRARNLRYLREQLKKHGLLPEADESTTREALIKTATGSVDEERSLDADSDDEQDKDDIRLLFGDGKAETEVKAVAEAQAETKAEKLPTPGDTEDDLASLLNSVLQPPVKEEVRPIDHSALLDALMPDPSPTPKSESGKVGAASAKEPAAVSEHDPVAWSAKIDKLRADIKKRIAEGATSEEVEEEVINFIETEGDQQDPVVGDNEDEDDDDEEDNNVDEAGVDWEARLEQIPGPQEEVEGLQLYGSAEALQVAKDREARLHKLQEHVKVNFDDSQKKQIFANEPVPGEPSIEFIHSYSMDPDVTMGSLGRRDFLQRKMVMKVHVPSLSLPPAVQQRLIDLVGTRYDARSGWLKLVGDKHPNRHLNQKYLKLLMRELLNESFLADSRYTPLASLDVQDPSSLRRKYSVPSTLQEVLDDKKAKASGGWAYRMFKFGRLDGHYPTAQQANEDAAKLRQRLASAFSS